MQQRRARHTDLGSGTHQMIDSLSVGLIGVNGEQIEFCCRMRVVALCATSSVPSTKPALTHFAPLPLLVCFLIEFVR